MTTFRWRGFDLPLFDHEYNATITNERAVEIPTALDFIARAQGWGLEVGNVLSHYFSPVELPDRRIVDRYEIAKGVENLDVFEIASTYDWIVCISTLEHVRWHPGTNQHNSWASAAAMVYLRGLLRPGGTMFATVGLGQNPDLDVFLHGTGQGRVLHRTRNYDDPADNHWDEGRGGPGPFKYGPTHGANAVWIGEWGPV